MSSDKKRKSNVIRAFSKMNVAVVGDIMLDEYVYGAVERINPDSSAVPLLRVTSLSYALGGAGNVAANVAALGAHTTLYGVLGEPKEGQGSHFVSLRNRLHNQIIISEAERAGIVTRIVYEGDTIVKQRIRERDHHGYIARCDWGEAFTQPISLKAKDDLLSKLVAHTPLDAIIISDYAKNYFLEGFAREIIHAARERNIPVFADPKPCNIGNYKEATLIRPNEREARLMVEDETSDIRSIARLLAETTRSESVVITRGKEGMLGYDGEFYELPTHARTVADVTGAGDTTIAALTLSLLAGATLPEAMYIANIAAGIVVEKAGTATVTREELLERMK